jgi:hypothetical protein
MAFHQGFSSSLTALAKGLNFAAFVFRRWWTSSLSSLVSLDRPLLTLIQDSLKLIWNNLNDDERKANGNDD